MLVNRPLCLVIAGELVRSTENKVKERLRGASAGEMVRDGSKARERVTYEHNLKEHVLLDLAHSNGLRSLSPLSLSLSSTDTG